MTSRPFHQLSPEIAGIGLVFYNERGHVVEANAIAQSILGLTSGLPAGQETNTPYWRLAGDGAANLAARPLLPLPANHVNGDVVSIHTRRGDVRHLKVGVHSCKHAGDKGFVVSLVDLTETWCVCSRHAADNAPDDHRTPLDPVALGGQFVSANDASCHTGGHGQAGTGFGRPIKCRGDRDALTGIGNRPAFLGQLGAALRGGSRMRASAGAVVLIDIDRFGRVNDTLGHDAGDELLRVIAARLGRVLRDSDMIARICGGEFALIIPDLATESTVRPVLERLLGALQQPHTFGQREVSPGFSVGVALFPHHGAAPQELLKHAGIALGQAKSNGHCAIAFYQAAIKSHLEQRQRMAEALCEAVRRNEVHFALQPQIRLTTGDVAGFEALARWRWHKRGIPPDLFIPLAEEIGLMPALGGNILRKALAGFHDLEAAGFCSGTLAVNVSVSELKHAGYAEMVALMLEAYDVPPHRLELEITESLLLDRSADQLVQTLDALHALGVRIALDDFGTGFASLVHLRQFRIDRLKIDRSFVTGIPDSAEDMAIVRAMIDLAHDLGMDVVAEGIETPEHLAFLTAQHCDIGQGYIFSRPESLERILATWPDQNHARQDAG